MMVFIVTLLFSFA